ncbi:glycoprotein 3-alpha-L-fucosyltransferase A-like [Pecten maximus]|uniref:glycoprotein 3-alpha-L-fucosyltransferase A-like n=1 Tax=Pecten maximus TaxID=6579 RepID=UPI001458FF8C|nr:glycoprotein 3-alpha-L-fucosyltransferase A-like [Pecten maximus]
MQETTCERMSLVTCSLRAMSIYHLNRSTKVLLLLLLLLTWCLYYVFNNRVCPRQNFFRRIHYIKRPEFLSADVFKNCEYACILTEGWDYSSADIVIWQGTETPLYPPRKYINQTWVFHSMEPPPLHAYTTKLWDGLINWTISYRRDSDFYSPYGIFRTVPNNTIPSADDALSNWSERSALLWFVSNCYVSSSRSEYVAEIEKYLNIDVYGRCGKNTCNGNWTVCSKYLQNKYRYYLSFESTLCRDYITEKSIKVYANLFNAIPITRSGANASLYLPPGSYLSTANFSSPEALARYLTRMKSPNSFFQWRQSYVAQDTIDSEQTFCELCRRSHTVNKYKRIYRSVNTWLRGNDGGVPNMCSKISDL